MSTEGIDAGLEELTSDTLGPAPDAPVEQAGDEAATEQSPEPIQSTEAPAASAPAPTPQEPQVFDVPGVGKLTAEQIAAMHTTAQQFPHLQKKYIERIEADKAAASGAMTPQAPTLSPKQVQSQIRTTFDPVVKSAVEQGFIEPDLAELYPDFMAGALMVRDTVTFLSQKVQEYGQKIAEYEAQFAQEREQFETQQFVGQLFQEFDGGLVDLSTKHPLLQPLADPKVRAEFTEYVKAADPKVFQLRDKKFVTGLWLSFRQDNLLTEGERAREAATSAAKVRADARRRAGGAPLTGSRPTGQPAPAGLPGLQDLVDDALAARQ